MPATVQIKASKWFSSVHTLTRTAFRKRRPRSKKSQPSEKYDRKLDLKRVEPAEIASNINKWLGSKISGKAC